MYGIEDETDAVMANHRPGRSKDGRLPGPIERYEPAGAPPKSGKKSDGGRRRGTFTGSIKGTRGTSRSSL